MKEDILNDLVIRSGLYSAATLLARLNANETADVDGTCATVNEILAMVGLTTTYIHGPNTWAIIPLSAKGV